MDGRSQRTSAVLVVAVLAAALPALAMLLVALIGPAGGAEPVDRPVRMGTHTIILQLRVMSAAADLASGRR